MGYPLRNEEFGGGFVVFACPTTSSRSASSTGLDYRDPMFDPHVAFQHFKRHPLIAAHARRGQLVRYGAKALPEGGWHTFRRLYARRRDDRGRRRRAS